jgi:hypothetical protein
MYIGDCNVHIANCEALRHLNLRNSRIFQL